MGLTLIFLYSVLSSPLSIKLSRKIIPHAGSTEKKKERAKIVRIKRNVINLKRR